MTEAFIPAPPAPPPRDCRELGEWLHYRRVQLGLYSGACLGAGSAGRTFRDVVKAEEATYDAGHLAFERAAFLRAQNVREVLGKLELLRDAIQLSAACDHHDVAVMLASIEADLEGLTGSADFQLAAPPAGRAEA